MSGTALCGCGQDWYDGDKYASCYSCFLERRHGYVSCVLCGRWHSPAYDVCYRCAPTLTVERKEAARALRQYVLWRDDYRCQRCGERGADLQIDHIKPCREGGDASPWNLQTLCSECNRIKGGAWSPIGRWARRRRELLGAYFFDWRRWLTADQRASLRRAVEELRRGGSW